MMGALGHAGDSAGVGGFAVFHKSGSELAFLTSVAAVVQAERPDAVLLLTADSGTICI